MHGSGSLLATGGSKGAGIGGGKVKINGGTVIAKGGQNAPGIDNGSPVTINGGTVTAMGGEGEVDSQGRANGGAGIGGGDGHDGGEVTVNGGTVTAFGSCGGAGIGGGFDGAGGTVSINGGTVSADGNDGGAAGIGGGRIFNGHERKDAGEVRLGTDVSVVDGKYGNESTFVVIAGPERAFPTCEGGTIEWIDAANAWVVAPNADVTTVSVTGLPEGDFVAVPPSVTKVSGVADAQIKVRSGAYDITGAFTVSGGAIALNPNGSVMIGGERIPVKPVIGELGCFDGEPFAVGADGVAITIRTIPGLFYGFRRGPSLADGEFAVLVWAKAERTNLSFTDKSQPELAAFYDIEVRTYVEEPLQSDGGFVVKSEVDPETLTIVGLNVDAAQNRVLLKVGAETTANVDSTVANFLNVTVRKGAEVTVKVEYARSPAGPWEVLDGVGGTVTVDRAGADIEVKLDGELPAQGYFRAKVEE